MSCFSLIRVLIFAHFITIIIIIITLIIFNFERDLRLHKLVFEEDVLPDGTEVAYYAHGKVALIDSCSALPISKAFIGSKCAFVLWAETVGRLQKGIWNSLYLLQL